MANDLLTAAILAQLGNKVSTSVVAEDYTQKPYDVGDYCYYGGLLRRCKEPITTAEVWTAAHWDTTTVAEELANLGGVAKRYGFRRTKAESSPTARITYLYDAVGMDPAYMDYTNSAFHWGDWKSFVESFIRPVMLNTDGTVAYELDHDDQTKKIGGTASDIADATFDGNAMVEFGKKFQWVKRYEDSAYEYVIFSNVRYDSDYHAYAHTNLNGVVDDNFYLGMFTGRNVSSKYRSIGAENSTVSTTAEQEITYAKANGTGYNIMDNMKWNYVLDLLTLMAKSDNLQAAYGQGNSGTSAQIANGTLKDKGAFFGYSTTASAVKTLWIENIWGNIWQRMAGLIYDNTTGTYKVKAYAPFCDTPVSAADYSTYTDTEITPPSSGYVKDANCGDEYGFLPKAVGGGSNTYFCDYFYIDVDAIRFALVGGYWASGGRCGRYVSLNNSASIASSSIGSRLSYTP